MGKIVLTPKQFTFLELLCRKTGIIAAENLSQQGRGDLILYCERMRLLRPHNLRTRNDEGFMVITSEYASGRERGTLYNDI